MGEPNPNGCCGVQTGCCDEKVPDRLMVTIGTDCGSFEGPHTGKNPAGRARTISSSGYRKVSQINLFRREFPCHPKLPKRIPL